jgi:hypothetical protein
VNNENGQLKSINNLKPLQPSVISLVELVVREEEPKVIYYIYKTIITLRGVAT